MSFKIRSTLARLGLLTTTLAVAGLVLAAPAEANSAINADDPTTPQPKVTNCVLLEGGGATCGENIVNAGALAAVAFQHPHYEGEQLNIYLPDGQPRCTEPRGDTDGWANLTGFWNNRVSSLYTRNHCDVELYDGPSLTSTETGWSDYCERLSLLAGDCSIVEGPTIRFDNRASSIRSS